MSERKFLVREGDIFNVRIDAYGKDGKKVDSTYPVRAAVVDTHQVLVVEIGERWEREYIFPRRAFESGRVGIIVVEEKVQEGQAEELNSLPEPEKII